MPGTIRLLVTLVLVIAISACSTPKVGGAPGLQVVSASEMPPPDGSDLLSSGGINYVGPGDKLSIDVYGIEDLSNKTVMIDSQGQISFPMAGTLQVAGMTPSDVQAALAQRLRENFVRNPQVTVNVSELVSQRVTVEGSVKKPGIYPVTGKMTLMGAIALGGGTDEFSKLDDVVVFRTAKGQKMAALFNLNLVRHGAYSDPEVFPGDIVMVGESSGRRLFKDILQTLPVLTAPLYVIIK